MNPVSNVNALPVPRLLSVLLHAETEGRERETLWDSLGLGSSRHAAVLAFRTRLSSVELTRGLVRADPACLTAGSGATIIAVASKDARLRRFAEMTPGIRAGIGGPAPVSEIHRSYTQALDALAFTDDGSPVSRVMSYSELGVLSLMARVPREELLNLPDLPAISGLEQEESGRGGLEAVEALCRTGTLRGAARLLHLHHSSVAKRISNVENVLGYRLSEPIRLGTAYATLLAMRLLKPDQASENH